jgi:Domain of unknown function (DUF5597)
MARSAGLKLVLIWFGAYKNGCLNYAPDYVKQNRRRFRRAHNKEGKELSNFACPTCTNTFERDRLALQQVFRAIAEIDRESNTVVLFQMENETGLLGTDRCYCEECNRRFHSEGWESRYAEHSAEAFSAASIARYVDGLAQFVKSIYPIPVYVNAWLAPRARVAFAGMHYPSGGPVTRMLNVFREELNYVDFIAPDIYQHSFRDFNQLCRDYSANDNPLYIAEHSSGVGSRAEKNVFYAIVNHAAIGFDPWAIDRAHPNTQDAPLVHPVGGRWSEEAFALRDSYLVIRDTMVPIASAQGTENLACFVQEEGENGTLLELPGIWAEVAYTHRDRSSRGLLIFSSQREIVAAGVGFSVRFCRKDGSAIAIRRAECGRFEGNDWHPMHPIRREGTDETSPLRIVEAQVARIELANP